MGQISPPPGVPPGRQVSAGTGLTGGGDLTADRSLALADTAVTPGAYTAANVTVDQQGRLTAAASGSVVAPTRQVATGTGLSGGGDLSADRTISIAAGGVGPTQLAATAVTPGAYTATNITVDQQGRITAAASGSSASKMFDVDSGLHALTNAGNENNVNFGVLGFTTYCRFGTSVNEHLTGVSNNGVAMGAGDDGRVICLYNEGTGPGVGNNAIINPQDANSTASNRFVTTGGGQVSILLGMGLFFRYNGTYLRWMQFTGFTG